MKDAGIDCDFLDERPLPGFTGKAIARYVPVVNERKVRENIRQRLSENHYDYLLVIKGESLSTKLCLTSSKLIRVQNGAFPMGFGG